MTRKQWREIGTAFALASLAIRLLIAVVHVPQAVAVEPGTVSLFSQVVLCTASGSRVVQLDENGQPVDPDNAPPLDAGLSCPVCTTLSAAPMASVPVATSLPVPPALFAATPLSATAHVMGRKPLVTRGRDPPTQA